MALRVEDIQLAPPAVEELLDFPAIFGNEHPVELEIGSGKGGFLLEQARARPQVNFLGVEWANKYYRYAADRMRRWGVSNVRLMRTDARNLVIHHLPEACLAAVHAYHPDPWPKKRHRKRRLFQPDFVDALGRAMRTRARLHVQSDHAEYLALIVELLRDCPALGLDCQAKEGTPTANGTPGTNFEIKYRREGRDIYGFTAVRL